MNLMVLITATIATAALCGCAEPAHDKPAAVATTAGQTRTTAIVTAVNAFLDTLSPAQRGQAVFEFSTPAHANTVTFKGGMNGQMDFVGEQFGKAVWSNFPVSDVPRPGLAIGTLADPQRVAAMRVLQVLLSADGYQKVLDIMDSDQKLADSGTHYASGTQYYTIGIFGAPSATQPWMLQFGGHHLGINAVVAGPAVSLTPTLTGDQPSSFTRNGQTVRPLGRETDKAFGLMNALSADQQRTATLNYNIDDLVLGPGHDGETLPPEGLCAANMSPAQREMLASLIAEWVGLLNADDASPKLAQVKTNLDQTYFAWHGSTANPSPVYFRITGPTLHIEFAHQQSNRRDTGVQAGGVNHIHTIYRDPTNEYGRGNG